MTFPVQITARSFPLTETIERQVLRQVQRMSRHSSEILMCRVLLDAPHRSRKKSLLYDVRVAVKLPGREIVVKRQQGADLYAAVRAAFGAATRQIDDVGGPVHEPRIAILLTSPS